MRTTLEISARTSSGWDTSEPALAAPVPFFPPRDQRVVDTVRHQLLLSGECEVCGTSNQSRVRGGHGWTETSTNFPCRGYFGLAFLYLKPAVHLVLWPSPLASSQFVRRLDRLVSG